MDRPWLAQYPAGIPAEIDVQAFASLKNVLASSCARFADLPAYDSMGTVMTFRQLDEASRAFAGDRFFERPFSFPTAPRAAPRTRQNKGEHCARGVDSLAGPAQKRPSGRYLRVTTYRRTAFIGPETPRTQPTPAALVARVA